MKGYLVIDNTTNGEFQAIARVVSDDKLDVITVPPIGMRVLTLFAGKYTLYVTKMVPFIGPDHSMQHKEYIISSEPIFVATGSEQKRSITNDYVREHMVFDCKHQVRANMDTKKYIEHQPFRQDSLMQRDPYPFGQLIKTSGQRNTESYENLEESGGRQYARIPKMAIPKMFDDYYYGNNNRSISNYHLDPSNTLGL